MCVFGGVKFNMEQKRREQEHHEKQQELQQLKHKDKSQQSEYIHTSHINYRLSTGFTFLKILWFSLIFKNNEIVVREESPTGERIHLLLKHRV